MYVSESSIQYNAVERYTTHHSHINCMADGGVYVPNRRHIDLTVSQNTFEVCSSESLISSSIA